MSERFTLSMELENIGPHYGDNKLSFSETVQSNKSILYSANGTGKSFISRAFRLCAPSKHNLPADEVLTLGKQNGTFLFCINSNGFERKLQISIDRGNAPVIQNSSGLIFHTFNSDYVEENIKPKHYSPDGNIEGYILGKSQIDITEEKTREARLIEEIKANNKKIDDCIDEAKRFLRNHGVTSNTREYQRICKDNLKEGFVDRPSDSVDECIKKLKKLDSVPEDLKDIDFSVYHPNLTFLDQLKDILLTKYPKPEWDEEFVKNYKENQSFIEAGLNIEQSDHVCPFCKREYNNTALHLIKRYNQYKTNQEALILKQLRTLNSQIEQIRSALDKEENRVFQARERLSLFQEFFPSAKALRLSELSGDQCKEACQGLLELISQKTDNLQETFQTCDSLIIDYCNAWETIVETQKNNQSTLIKANSIKNHSGAERLSLRRNLCIAKTIEIQNSLSDTFLALLEKTNELEQLRERVEKIERKIKVSKRDKVYETLESTLNRFFNRKYEIDRDTFQIKFLGNKVGENASSILSDGEKSIVAFCWYLAETHTIINNEDDYSKLFFVIDDPISSMDFHYVYAVAQTIREIKDIFNISGHERVWVFTHNNEFFSIVMRNNILTNAFYMKPGSIQKFNHKLLMPYENHLMDLTKIADGQAEPNHTTGNSIRHIVETVARFEKPEIGLDTYVKKEPLLLENSCIFTLCQDLSHGGIRFELPYSEDVLREAAKVVIRFIESRYPGQLKCRGQ